jgi:hypothetical protein
MWTRWAFMWGGQAFYVETASNYVALRWRAFMWGGWALMWTRQAFMWGWSVLLYISSHVVCNRPMLRRPRRHDQVHMGTAPGTIVLPGLIFIAWISFYNDDHSAKTCMFWVSPDIVRICLTPFNPFWPSDQVTAYFRSDIPSGPKLLSVYHILPYLFIYLFIYFI